MSERIMSSSLLTARWVPQSKRQAKLSEWARVEQWKNPLPKPLKEGAVAQIADVRPAIETGNPPVLFLPGWSETPKDFYEGIAVLAATRRVLAISPSLPTITSRASQIHDTYVEEIGSLLTQNNITKPLSIVARSGNAITAVKLTKKLAIADPEHADQLALVLITPSGLLGKKSLSYLGRRLVEQAKESITVNAQDALAVMHSSPLQLLSLSKEAYAISRSHMQRELTELREQYGVHTAVINTIDDVLYPSAEMLVTTNKENANHGYAQVDEVLTMPGIHSSPKEQQSLFMRKVNEILDKLHRRRS
jgi:hypothetical protein